MSDDIKKGLMGVTVDETSISKVMPEINSLTYRGYAAQDLCANCNFEEVAYLILNKELPNKNQLQRFVKQERNESKLSKTLLNSIMSSLVSRNIFCMGALIFSSVIQSKTSSANVCPIATALSF